MHPHRRPFTPDEIRALGLNIDLAGRVQSRLRAEAPVGNYRGAMLDNVHKAILAEIESLFRQEFARLWTALSALQPKSADPRYDPE